MNERVWSLVSAGQHPEKESVVVATILVLDKFYNIELEFADGGMTGLPDDTLGDIMEKVFDGSPSSDEEQAVAHGADDFMACVAEGEISLEPPVFDADRLELVTLSEGTHSSLSMGADGVLRGTKYDLGDSDRKSTSLEVREIEPLINAFLRQLGEMSFREVSTWLRENGVEHLVSTENFD